MLAAPMALVLAATVLSYANGSLPGTAGLPGPVPTWVARQAPSCGHCHTLPGPMDVAVSVTPTQRSLDQGQAISLQVSGSGGPATTWGGFVTEVTAGSLVAGATSQVDATGKFISHTRSFWGRSWAFGYAAPTAPGLVEVFTAVNAANMSGTPEGDSWAFHGDPSAQLSVPVRLYANAAGVTHRGAGCIGSFGNWPVLGSKEAPTIANASFGFELHGAAPSTGAVLFLGFNANYQIPLGVIGVTECTLWAEPSLSILAATGPGNAQRGDGVATFPLPLPNNPFLRGFTLQVQAAFLDPLNGRRLPLTLSNGLSFTIG